jgi:integrase
MLAILYGGGLRRAELCGLDLDDFDAGECLITVRSGKGRRDRRVFLSAAACKIVKRWVTARGTDDGPLFVPISSRGTVRHTRLRGEAVRYILQKRQRQAGLTGITPHDLRRYAESRIMPSPPEPSSETRGEEGQFSSSVASLRSA